MTFEHNKYEVVARDNTYNQENDFNHDFTWSIWSNKPNGDWCWDSDIYVAVCQHYGGDPRNNWYSTPKLFAVDSIADSGFLDWVLGWGVSWSRCSDFLDCEPSDLTEDQAKEIASDTFNDKELDRLNERCCIGYSSNPTCELADHCDDGDSCFWIDGSAIVRIDGKWAVCSPYHYQAEIITPENGSGYSCDAMIDFDSFIENTLGEQSDDILDDMEKINPEIEIDGLKIKQDWDGIDWDNDERIADIIAHLYFVEWLLEGEQA